jgi:hypothetical protein
LDIRLQEILPHGTALDGRIRVGRNERLKPNDQ